MRIRHIKGAEEAVSQSPLVICETGVNRGSWNSAVFGRSAPLRVEIGMGMGTFIRTHAVNEPDINFIGYEINTTVLYKALQRYIEIMGAETDGAVIGAPGVKAAAPGLKALDPSDCNLRFLRSDARFIAEDFAEGEIDRIYLNFSDPWPKDKSANKRLTSPVFLKLYRRILKEGGKIEFKTDNRPLFDYSLETFPGEGWTLEAVTYDLHNDPVLNAGNICTEYEAKFSAKGNPICKLIARK